MPAPITGQTSITGTAQQLDSAHASANCSAYTLKTPSTNTHTVYIGPSGVTTATGYAMEPGDEFTYQRNNQLAQQVYPLSPFDWYAVGTAGSDVITWFASPPIS